MGSSKTREKLNYNKCFSAAVSFNSSNVSVIIITVKHLGLINKTLRLSSYSKGSWLLTRGKKNSLFVQVCAHCE